MGGAEPPSKARKKDNSPKKSEDINDIYLHHKEIKDKIHLF